MSGYIDKFFSLKFTLRCTQSILFLLFATGFVDTVGKLTASVIDTGGNLPPVSLILVANLPLVSTIPAVPVANFEGDVVDTEGKFATGVIDTSSAP